MILIPRYGSVRVVPIPRYGLVRVVPRPRDGLIRVVHVNKDPVLVLVHKLYLLTKDHVNTLLKRSIWLYLKSILSTRSKCLDSNSHLEPTVGSGSRDLYRVSMYRWGGRLN